MPMVLALIIVYGNILLSPGDSLHCPPLDRPYKPHVLAHYPSSQSDNPIDKNAVCMVRMHSQPSLNDASLADIPHWWLVSLLTALSPKGSAVPNPNWSKGSIISCIHYYSWRWIPCVWSCSHFLWECVGPSDLQSHANTSVYAYGWTQQHPVSHSVLTSLRELYWSTQT